MENLTHSLVGATLAELALPDGANATQRRLFFAAGIIAANLPDADLLYARITPPPLGYLLHHRGHTHTIGGLVVQALLIGAVCLIPAIRRNVGTLRARLLTLIVAGLLSHLALDAWNSYGIHPFWPFDVRWYYGDAVNIFEPWIWLLLGVAATANTRSPRGGLVLGALIAVLTAALALFGMIPVGALIALVVAAAVLTTVTVSWTPRRRSAGALTLTMLFVAAMFGLRQFAHEKVLSSRRQTARGDLVDVVLSAQPANPLCWNALAIEKDEPAGEYVMTRGVVTPVLTRGCGSTRRVEVQWAEPVHQSLAQLRNLTSSDCWVRAWMQFGRAPQIERGWIGDYRYGGAVRGNFTAMLLRPREAATACPAHLTHWAMPREDLEPHRAQRVLSVPLCTLCGPDSPRRSIHLSTTHQRPRDRLLQR